MSILCRGSSMSKNLETEEWKMCLGKAIEPMALTYLICILCYNRSCDSMLSYNVKWWFICYLLATQFPVSFWSSSSSLLVWVAWEILVPVSNKRNQRDQVFSPNKTIEWWPHDVRLASLHYFFELAWLLSYQSRSLYPSIQSPCCNYPQVSWLLVSSSPCLNKTSKTIGAPFSSLTGMPTDWTPFTPTLVLLSV